MESKVNIIITTDEAGNYSISTKNGVISAKSISELLVLYADILDEPGEKKIKAVKAYNLNSIMYGWQSYEGWAIFIGGVPAGFTGAWGHRYTPETVEKAVRLENLQKEIKISERITGRDMILVESSDNEQEQNFVRSLGEVSVMFNLFVRDAIDSWNDPEVQAKIRDISEVLKRTAEAESRAERKGETSCASD